MAGLRDGVWLAAAAASLAMAQGAVLSPLQTGTVHAFGLLPAAWASAPAEQGGGGEAGEEEGGGRIADEEGIAAQLLMMEASLERASRLLAKGFVNDAGPLLELPMNELWEPVHESLEQRIPSLELALEEALAEADRAVDEGNAASMQAAAQRAQAELARAYRQLVPADRRASPAFRVAVGRRILEQVPRTYRAAVEGDPPTSLAAYRLARAFLERAEEEIMRRPGGHGSEEAPGGITKLIAELEKAIPAGKPPADPAPAGKVYALVSNLELELGSID